MKLALLDPRPRDIAFALCATLAITVQAGNNGKGNGGGGDPSPTAPVSYVLSVVPPLEPGAYSEIFDINSAGLAVGGSSIVVDSRLWRRGIIYDVTSNQTTDVNDLINDPTSYVDELMSINENGWMAGIGYHLDQDGNIDSGITALLVTPDLDDDGNYELLPLVELNSDARVHINNDGDVAGSYSVFPGDQAFIWTPEHGAVGFGYFDGRRTFSHGLTDRISGAIQIVLSDASDPGAGNFALTSVFDVQSGTVSPYLDLGFLYSDRRTPGGSNVAAINNFSVIAGTTTVNRDDSFAATYRQGLGWSSLGTLSSTRWNNSSSIDINDSNWVLGTSLNEGAPRTDPFVHVDSVGMFNLYDLLDPADVAVLEDQRITPNAISNANHIGGSIHLPNTSFFTTRGVVFTPVQSPE